MEKLNRIASRKNIWNPSLSVPPAGVRICERTDSQRHPALPILVGLCFAAMLLMPAVSRAGTLDMPSAETFDTHTVGAKLANSTGPWYGNSNTKYSFANTGASGTGFATTWVGIGQTSTSTGNASDYKAFTATQSGVTYASFYLYVNQVPSGTAVAPLMGFDTTGSASIAANTAPNVLSVAATKVTASTYTLGVRKGNATVLTYATTGALAVNTSYFVVVARYPGAGSDAKYVLWVNPTDETTGGITNTDLSVADNSGINSCHLMLNQNMKYYVDTMKFGPTWGDVDGPGGCNPASITSGASPSSTNANVGSTATFSVKASGTLPAYQWQASTDGGSVWGNVSGPGTDSSYTTASLTTAENGYQYRCLVSVPCDGSSVTSSVAHLFVSDLSKTAYRSVQTGPWNDGSTWETSTNGLVWSGGNLSGPGEANSNITVRATHTVSITNNVTADQLTIEAGAVLEMSGGVLTIQDDPAYAVDCDVFGTLQVANVVNSSVTNNGGLTMESGGLYVWNNPNAAAVIPVATWADGSTCEVQDCTTTTPAGLGQSFYDFHWNKTSPGRVNLGGQLTNVRHNLNITGSLPDQSVRFLMVAGTTDLYVGNDIVAESGSITLSGGSAAGTIVNLHIGRNLVINSGASIDSRSSGSGSSVSIIFTNASASASFLNGASSVLNTGGNSGGGGCPIYWKIESGAVLTLVGGNLPVNNALGVAAHDSVTVDGTLDCDGNQIVGPGDLIINASGTLVGEGTGAIATGLNSLAYDGTLNLPNLPDTLNNGDPLYLFNATSYSGAGFTTIIPDQTPTTALGWDQLQLPFSGTLYVGVANVPPFKITGSSLSGDQLTLTGTGGTPGGGFTVLTSTDLETPIDSWTSWTTGNFDGSGSFSVTATIPVDTQSYFRVRIP